MIFKYHYLIILLSKYKAQPVFTKLLKFMNSEEQNTKLPDLPNEKEECYGLSGLPVFNSSFQVMKSTDLVALCYNFHICS